MIKIMAKFDMETKVLIAFSAALIAAILLLAYIVNSTTNPALLRARAYAVDACMIKMAHEDIAPHQKTDLCAGFVERMEAIPEGAGSEMLDERADFIFKCMTESAAGSSLSKIELTSHCEQLLKRIEK